MELILDNLLKQISKTQDLKKINEVIESFIDSNCNKQEILLMLVLRALTDKGFKSHASMLSQEYYNEECLDGDGKIYGLDWIYINPPLILQHIPNKDIVDIREFKPIR